MRAALAVLVLGCSASACTSSEPVLEVEPEPARVGEPPPVVVEPPPAQPEAATQELGPLLGGTIVKRKPTPGRWASSVRFSQHRFVTMEHTVAEGVSGSAVVRLGDDGTLRACFATRNTSSSSISHYQARDGKDHHSADDHAVVVGMSGSWALDGEGPEILVVFDRMTWQTCEVDTTREAFAQPPLRCFGFTANAAVPIDALLCSVPETLHWIADLALLIGDTPRAGPWALRHDLSGRGEMPPQDAVPWLLLGAEPGVELHADDTDRDPEPLTIRVGAVADPEPLPAD